MAEKKEFTYEMLMEAFAETDRKIKQLSDKINATNEMADKTLLMADKTLIAVNKTTANVDGISKSNGAMAEEMIYNSLKKDKIFGGIKFDEIDRNLKLKLKKFNLEGEFDVVLQNCDTLAIIETKYKVRIEDVSKLVDKKVNDFRKLFPVFNDYKIILGVGGMSFEEKAEEEAEKNGVGIIKIVGDRVEYFTDRIKVY